MAKNYPNKYQTADLIAALAQSDSIVAAAEIVGCNESTFRKRAMTDSALREAMDAIEKSNVQRRAREHAAQSVQIEEVELCARCAIILAGDIRATDGLCQWCAAELLLQEKRARIAARRDH